MKPEKPDTYASGLATCSTLEQLRSHVLAYEELALDAVEIVRAMTPADFKVFRRGLRLERSGTFAGEAWAKRFAAVAMPQPMLTIALFANQYEVTFFVAHRRLKEHRPDLLGLRYADTRA